MINSVHEKDISVSLESKPLHRHDFTLSPQGHKREPCLSVCPKQNGTDTCGDFFSLLISSCNHLYLDSVRQLGEGMGANGTTYLPQCVAVSDTARASRRRRNKPSVGVSDHCARRDTMRNDGRLHAGNRNSASLSTQQRGFVLTSGTLHQAIRQSTIQRIVA
jgi:hypothetical protein